MKTLAGFYRNMTREQVEADSDFKGYHPESKRALLAILFPETEPKNGHSTPADAPVETAQDMSTKTTTTTDAAFRDYSNYVTSIFRPGDTLCFVSIDHNQQGRTVNEFIPYDLAVRREYFERLQHMNSEASIYVATNTYPASLIGQKTGRTQENVVEVRAVQADVDYNGEATINAIKSSELVPAPSIVVQSSPGKFQGIWLVDNIAKPEAKPLMQAIASAFNTDSAVAEVARVMRVPGFVNRKYESAPTATTLLQTNTRFRREDFKVSSPQTSFEQRVAPEEYLNAPFIRKGGVYGGIYNHVLKIVGHYVSTIKDGDVMFDIVNGLKERNGCFQSDGVTPYEWDEDKVRRQCTKLVNEWKDTSGYRVPSSQQPSAAPQTVDVSNWQSMFRSIGEMEDGPIDMIIEGALQEGTCFLGATAGDGKTLVALAFSKAICTGTPLFGLPMFSVKTPRPVIYLIPESRDRAFRKRCEAFKLPNDKTKFMTRTISAGVPLELNDPRLLEAVKQTKAVVILDTAARFMKGNDENSATQNKLLVDDVVGLLAAGAVCVILIHHATKSAKQNQEVMTLENMLRGSGDLGAMCDQAYGIRKDMKLYDHGRGSMEIDLVNLKDREQIGGLNALRLAASYLPPKRVHREDGSVHENMAQVVSYITEKGNFHVVSSVETVRRESIDILDALKQNLTSSAKELAKLVNVTEYRVRNEAEKAGWFRENGGKDGATPWHKHENGTCPFKNKDVIEIKPKKAVYDPKLPEVVEGLRKLLEGTAPDGDYIAESVVLEWADKKGITEAMLGKARRRVGVVIEKANGRKVWALPEPENDEDEGASEGAAVA